MNTRSPRTTIAVLGALAVLITSCSSTTDPATTITSKTTVAAAAAIPATPSSISTNGAGTSSRSSVPTSPDAPTTTTRRSPTSTSQPVVGALPDGFVPTKLKPGQKAPQFIVVSFDGVGWHEKWQYWRDIASKVPFHFTGFLTGVYLLSGNTKSKYQGPGHGVGKSSVGWNAPNDLPVEIADLNQAYRAGNEIASHFNGHFCAGDGPSGNDWATKDWNNELDQFFALMANVRTNNGLPASTALAFGAKDIKGERTPCLEGTPEALYPALKSHNLTYDSSFTRRGISWPTQSQQDRIWQLGMAEFPMHGTKHFQITMDYNFYYSQRNGSSTGVTPQQSTTDSAQVQATYQDMYNATIAGNRAPLILGNHFNAWNNNAYSKALGGFLLANCAKPGTYCVPFRDVLAWMKMQDPAVLAKLQAQAPELGPPNA